MLTFEEEEEEAIARTEDDILLSTDVVIGDDTLIPIMWDALKQYSNPSPKEVIAFVLRIIGNRGIDNSRALENVTRDRNYDFRLDLRPLSRRAWIASTDILADMSNTLPIERLNAISNYVLSILTSYSSHATPTSSMRTIHAIYDFLRHGEGRIGADAPEIIQGLSNCLALRTITALLCEGLTCELPQSLVGLGVYHPEIFANATTRRTIEDMWPGVVAVADPESWSERPYYYPEGALEALHVVFSFAKKLEKTEDAARVLIKYWLHPSLYHEALSSFAALHRSNRHFPSWTFRESNEFVDFHAGRF